MRNIILFDQPDVRNNLLPLTFTRPVADIRIGILTIREKWERMFPGEYSYKVEDYLSVKFPVRLGEDNYFIAGHICPDAALIGEIEEAEPGTAWESDGKVVFFRGTYDDFCAGRFRIKKELVSDPVRIEWLYDIFMKNGIALEADYRLLATGRKPCTLSASNHVIGDAYYADGTPKIFVEEGASVECAVLNLTHGPVYIGRDAEIMEGSCIRAPFAACEHVVVNMGTKIYGATTLGPYTKVGGELNNVVMFGYSNKAHEGFLGNAVIGEWCNMGAGTTASNLKNDYSEIKLWNYPSRRFLRTGLQFCGLTMGDHSKSGVNCMFNTATVIGVGVNVYGSGFPRNFVASFSEGGTAGFSDVQLDKFFTIAEKMMARRGKELTETDRTIFRSIYNQAEVFK